MNMEKIRGVEHTPVPPVPMEGFNPDAEYDAKMADLERQREAFIKGIAEYQGNLDKVNALRKKLNNKNLLTDKEAVEKERMWRLNKSEYEGGLMGVEKQIQELDVKYGKSGKPSLN